MLKGRRFGNVVMYASHDELPFARRQRPVADDRGDRGGDRGRQDPEHAILTMAFERLRARSGNHLQPARTVAIEDSSNGIRAGAAAGMPVVAVPTRPISSPSSLWSGW